SPSSPKVAVRPAGPAVLPFSGRAARTAGGGGSQQPCWKPPSAGTRTGNARAAIETSAAIGSRSLLPFSESHRGGPQPAPGGDGSICAESWRLQLPSAARISAATHTRRRRFFGDKAQRVPDQGFQASSYCAVSVKEFYTSGD